MKKLVECVPNISEGNNQSIIKKIVKSIEDLEDLMEDVIVYRKNF